jgi:hypothetical protein
MQLPAAEAYLELISREIRILLKGLDVAEINM